MRRLLTFFKTLGLAACAGVAQAQAQGGFTLQQVMSAPYATSLTAAPVGARFAWVEDAEGRHNLWTGGPNEPARQLTHNTEDDAQDIMGLEWSPDGAGIAYVFGAEHGANGKPANPAHLQRDTAWKVLVQPVKGGEPRVIGEGRSPMFSRDGASLLFLRNGQIFSVDLRDAASQAKSEVIDRGAASQMTLSPDGKLLAYVSSRSSGGRTHGLIAVYSFTDSKLTFVAPSTGRDAAPVFSPDGKYLAWLRWPFTDGGEFDVNRVSANPWSIQVMDVATGGVRQVFSPEANKPGSAGPRMSTGEPKLMWTADDRVLFFSEADGWVHLYSVDVDGKSALKQITSGGETEDAALSPDQKTLYYSSTGPVITCMASFCSRTFALPESADLRTVWSRRLDTGETAMPHTPLSVIAAHPVVLSDGGVAALVSNAAQPMAPMVVSAEPARLSCMDCAQPPRTVTKLPSQYPAHGLLRPQQVIFDSADGLKIHGQLFLPVGDTAKKHATLIFVHGGPKRQMLLGYPSMDYYSNAYAMNQYLASRGFIVLSVNYRGGIGYGLDFRQQPKFGAAGASEYNDVLAAAKYLQSRPDVDPKRIGIWGGSYGGYLTALALARNSDIFAAGVDFHGVHEWAAEDNASADWLRGPLAEQEKIAALAHASSPMADLDKWKSPVLLIHGDNDPDVEYNQTPMLADGLRARGVHVEEMIFPDEVHGFLLHRDWLAAYTATAAFFERTLKPGSPSLASQPIK